MKKYILLIFAIVALIIIFIFLINKSEVETSETSTDKNGVVTFYDMDTKEEVKIIVLNESGENLEDIHVGYIDGKGFEYFQFEDPSGKYMPEMEIYPHNSIHSITMSLPNAGPIIEKYNENDSEKYAALELFSRYIFDNPQVVDHGVRTLEEWDDMADEKIGIVALVFPLTGGKLKIIGNMRQIIRAVIPNIPYSDPKQKYRMYSYLAFDGITTQIRCFVEVNDEQTENTGSDSGKADNLIGTWKKIGGGIELDPYLESYLKITKENGEFYVAYVTWHDLFIYHKIKTSLINGNLVGSYYQPNSVIVKSTGIDLLLFTIDPLGEFVPIKEEIYIRNNHIEIICDEDNYCEIVVKEDQAYKNKIPVRTYSENGNIYVDYNEKLTRQLTYLGCDSKPVLSPDKKTVAFVRRLLGSKIEDAWGNKIDNSQIWVFKLNEYNETLLVKVETYPEFNIYGDFTNICYSPCSQYIYFMDQCAIVTDCIFKVDIRNRKINTIGAGNYLEVIQNGRYSGCLIVTKHKYFEVGGSYDYYWLLSPEGKEIKMVGKDDNELLEFKKKEVFQTKDGTSFYIINVSAVKTEYQAQKEVNELNLKGYNSGYLWIPDYPSLSGAEYYAVYIGPFSTQSECEIETEKYRKINPNAYGLLVSQENKRVEIRGINKVKIISN